MRSAYQFPIGILFLIGFRRFAHFFHRLQLHLLLTLLQLLLVKEILVHLPDRVLVLLLLLLLLLQLLQLLLL